jgi:hypothetical protein
MFTLAGCGTQDRPLVPVSGQVTLDGSPLKEVVVNFTPIGETKGSGALAGTNLEGRFTLIDVRGQPGAHVGEYKVSLYPTSVRPPSDVPIDVVMAGNSGGLPEVYINPVYTPLRATIPEGGGNVEIHVRRTGKDAAVKTTPFPP